MTKKIRDVFLINVKGRRDVQKEIFTDWLNSQSNATSSILSLIEHSIDRFGYSDITDHHIAKKMHNELLYFNNEAIIPQDDVNKKIQDEYPEPEPNPTIHTKILNKKTKESGSEIEVNQKMF